jgi:predicted SprT family Zn-dependent metalloprotease
MVYKAKIFGTHKLRRLSTVGMFYLESLKMSLNRNSYQDKKNQKIIEFELKNKEIDSIEEHESIKKNLIPQY